MLVLKFVLKVLDLGFHYVLTPVSTVFVLSCQAHS